MIIKLIRKIYESAYIFKGGNHMGFISRLKRTIKMEYYRCKAIENLECAKGAINDPELWRMYITSAQVLITKAFELSMEDDE